MIQSLRSAALPEAGSARVATVGERGLDATATALEGLQLLRQVLPGWALEDRPLNGSPAGEIVRESSEWEADLVSIGAFGQTALPQFLVGSVAFKVANEVRTSVRVCRAVKARRDILIAYDGKESCRAAVASVCRRKWSGYEKVVLFSCVGFGVEPDLADIESQKEKLEASGLAVRILVKEDDPKQAILAEAAKLEASCIFLGDNDETLLDRILLGTVAGAVLPRAECTVEIVRRTAPLEN